jgi:hypothetical protein
MSKYVFRIPDFHDTSVYLTSEILPTYFKDIMTCRGTTMHTLGMAWLKQCV